MQAKPCNEARNFIIRDPHAPKSKAAADKNKANVLHRKALDIYEELEEAKLLKEALA